jgi:hypothetical protein
MAMLKLSLTRRPAKIGKSINTRTEMHGEEEVPGLDIPINGMLINAAELALLTDCATAYDGLFIENEALGVVPRISSLEPLHIGHKFENATVRVTGSSIDNETFANSKIKSIKLEPQTGGLTLLSFTLQVNPENGIDVPRLLNAKISIAIKAAELETDSDEQPELPMEHSQDEIDQADQEEAAATERVTGGKKRRGRAAHASNDLEG